MPYSIDTPATTMIRPTDTPQRPVTAREDAVGSAEELTVERIEERLTIGKRLVTTGEVTLRKTVELGEEHVTLQRLETDYEVERVAVGTLRDEAPAAIRELPDGTIVYAVVREVPVVVTRYELVEEIHVRPRHRATDEDYVLPVRRERIDIERKSLRPSADEPDRPEV